MSHRLLVCLVGTCLLVLCPLSLEAQPLFQVNTDTDAGKTDANLAMDANGNFTVVWTSGDEFSTTQDGGQGGIYAQRYNEDGTPAGAEFLVNTATAGNQTYPGVGMDDAGNFVVAWQSYADFSNSVEAQRFDSSGAPVGSQFQVKASAPSYSDSTSVGMAGDSSFVVSWAESGNGVHAQRFDSVANPVDGEIVVSTGEDWSPALDVFDDGRFVLAWQERFSSRIQARRYNSDGTAAGPEFTVATGFDPDVAHDPSGGFMVVWGNRTSTTSVDAYGRRYDSNGVATGPSFILTSDNTTEESNPTIDFSADGSYAVAWSDGNGLAGTVGARRFAADNTPLSPNFVFANEPNPRFPIVEIQPDGDLAVVWHSNESPSSNRAIRGCLGLCQGPDPNGIGGDLIGHWTFDEGTGDVVADSSDNELDGTLEGSAGWTVGQQSNAGLFDGIDRLVRVVDDGIDSPLDLTGGLTIALWVRPDAIDGSIQVLVSKDDAYELEFGKAGAALWDLRLNNVIVFTGATVLEEGVWQHLAVTWDGTEVCGYYNGLADGCSPYAATLLLNTDDLGLGGRPTSVFEGGPVFHLTGALDEVYLYGNALSDTNIADLVIDELTDVFPPVRSNLAPASSVPSGTISIELTLDTDETAECRYGTIPNTAFDALAGTFGTYDDLFHHASVPVVDGGIYTFYVRCRDTLGNTNSVDTVITFGVEDTDLCTDQVADWLLDEGAGCLAADATGANDADLGPSCDANAPVWVAGRDGSNGALAFDGDDDVVSVASPVGLSGAGEVTVAAWIQHNPTGIFRSIVDHRDAGNDGFDLYLSANSKAFIRVNSLTLEGNTVVADGAWHHVVGVYDGSELRIYVDGQLDASASTVATTLDVSAPLVLGRNFATTQFSFAGNLDEVTLYGRGLSDIEVLDLYLGADCGAPN